MATPQQGPTSPAPVVGERLGFAIAALVLAIVAIVFSLPFLVFEIFPPTPPPGTEDGLGGVVLATIGYGFALFLVVPSIVLSTIFSIVAIAKSRRAARTLGRAALIVTVVAFAATIFLIAKIFLPFWLASA